MKKQIIVFLLFLAVNQFFAEDMHAQVTGNATDSDQQPLYQVHVIIKGTDRGVYTDAYGAYTIMAKPGDLLSFSYVGMQPVEVRVKKSPSVIDVTMEAVSLELQQLEVKAGRRSKSPKDLLAEYPQNKNLIKTSWGIIDQESSSVRMRIIDGKDLTLVGTDFLYALQNHYPQLHVDRSDPLGVAVYLQKMSYTSDPPAIFDVDGLINVSTPTYLNANDIERVAILDRNAAIFKYGPQGAGGVIVINTKAQTWMDETPINRHYDNRTMVDSLIREVKRMEEYQPYEPAYIGKLHEAKTEEQALAIYTEEKKEYPSNPYYLLEAYDYFSSHWGNKQQINELFRHLVDNFRNDVVVLKALAYLQQQQGHYEIALPLYLKILEIAYGNPQAHRDVANAYNEKGDFAKALITYTQYANDICQLPHTAFDADGSDLLMATEMRNILEQNKAFFADHYDLSSTPENSDTLVRLVVEWNHPGAEFEIQLIPPDGQYDTWSNKAHEQASPNAALVQQYFSKQFLIAKENEGSWQVHVDYQGNRPDVPTYLKVAVSYDFGLASQRTEIKVYKLSETHRKVQLLLF